MVSENCSTAADGIKICYITNGNVGVSFDDDDSSGPSLLHDITVVVVTIIATCIALAAYNYHIHCQIQNRKKNAGDDNDNETQPAESEAETLGRSALSQLSIAASLAHIEGMEASGNFLSGLFAQMWHHTNIAVSNAIKETLEPSLKEMNLHFVKLDLGSVPIQTTNMFIHRVDLDSVHAGKTTKQKGIQIDVDVNWNGNCDVMLQATINRGVKFTFGVKSIKLSGRMHILLGPLTTELPIISAVQYGFANPPDLRLDFSGAVKTINSLSFVQTQLVKVIQSSLASVLVLPQRMVMPIDLGGYDYLDTYKPPVGMVRLTAVSGRGFKIQGRGPMKDIPDVYCLLSLGASSDVFKTSRKMNNLTPSWKDEHCDYILYDVDQKIYVQAYDWDKLVDSDDKLGNAEVSVRDLFRNNGTMELELEMKGRKTESYVTVLAELFHLSDQVYSFSSLMYEGKNQLCGLVTIIVTRAFDIPVPKEDAATHVKVVYGEGSEHEKIFYTGTVADYPGLDALNPMYDSVFHVPLTATMLKHRKGSHGDSKEYDWSRNNIVFRLIDADGSNGSAGRGELGKFSVTHESLRRAYKHSITETRLIGGGGASLEFRVILSGMQSESEKSQWAARKLSRLGLPQERIDLPRSMYGGKYERDTNVRVTALRGRGFLKEDDVLDVYLIIKLNSQRQTYRLEDQPPTWRTATIKDDTMPQWNETKDYFYIEPARDFLRVDVWEENAHSKDECLGSANFSLEKLLRKRFLEMELGDESSLTKSYVTLMCVRL